MSFRAVADEVGLTAVGVAVAAYLSVHLRKRFKSTPRVPLVETPKHEGLVAGCGKAGFQSESVILSKMRSPKPEI